MQRGVHGRLLDNATSVREAAVDLLGRSVLSRPILTAQYLDMLLERILDTGISVRKRVIKILRDICLDQPDCPRITEMCVKMIRRVNDEEGIKKLVNETFQKLWFSPSPAHDSAGMIRKVQNITDVVSACKDTGFDWFEQLLQNLLKLEEDSASRPVRQACSQIINCLVDSMLKYDEGKSYTIWYSVRKVPFCSKCSPPTNHILRYTNYSRDGHSVVHSYLLSYNCFSSHSVVIFSPPSTPIVIPP
uniref:Nipped-B-like protein n=1 Tax=Eptatretus burgeri TaxID=7764 RepID=A0A8C4R600_EPTBU